MVASSKTENMTVNGTVYEYPGSGYNDVGELDPERNTVAKAFVFSAKKYANRVAMRKKRYGIWQEYTWAQSLADVKAMALGLMSLGLERGETVSIIGENDPEFYQAQYAVHAVGAISVAIFTDANPQELQYVVTDSDSVFLFAHDQEQCDKALELKAKFPKIRRVIYWDDRGLWNYQDPWLMSMEQLKELGRQYEREHPKLFEERIAQSQPDDVAIFSYTSGTSGLPKGAMVMHRNLIYATAHTTHTVPTFDNDEYVSFSPLAWITEQGLGYAGHARTGFTVNFPEGPETVQTDIREVAPSSLLFPSRIWENLARTMQIRVSDSSWLNRLLYRAFMPVAYRVIDLEDEGKPISPHLRVARWLADVTVLQPLRDKIGMTRMRNAFTSGAVLSPDVLRFFRAVGVTLKSLYGSTEMQGAAMHHEGNIRLESVGAPIPGVQIKIAPDGEIRVKSRCVFKGYYHLEDKTAEAFDEDGFFCTGDAGYISQDGHLIYLDRVKDMLELANGEKFSPQYIEGRLKFSPYIQDVMAVGGFDMEFVTAIVIIDFENVSRWAEKNRINFTTYVDLTQKPEIYAMIKKEVERVNATLPPAARIKKFVILHKAFDADEAELTRTRKLRRHALEKRYGEMLDAMYGDRDKVTVSAEVKYRDGRTGVVETDVHVMTV